MSFPKPCLVDTNVPKTANLASKPDPNSDVTDDDVLECIRAIEHVINNRCLVIDVGDEIYDEYRGQLSLRGQPGVGDGFLKWVHDHRWGLPDSQRVTITTNGDSYDEFPSHPDLEDFDRSDRKFVAAANAHENKAQILQATDSKWWGWKSALAELGIIVHFLCPEYVKAKYPKKARK